MIKIKHLPGQHSQQSHAGTSYSGVSKQEMLDQFKEWNDSLTPEDRMSLNNWQGGTGKYKEINSYLRSSDETKQWAKNKDKLEGWAQGIEKAISKGSLKGNTVLYRVCNIPDLHPKQGNKLIGTEFTDKGFVATTIDKEYTKKFSFYIKNPYTIQINAPKGTKGAFMDAFNDKKESEFLMPPNQRFIVTGVDKKTKTVTVELVDE